MAFGAEQTDRLDRLDRQLRLAAKLVTGLFGKVIADVCTRIPVLRPSGKAARIDRLIETGAWIDAAFALIELELPAWKVRRLANENGEWLCSLARQSNLPAGLDDTVDASHELLPVIPIDLGPEPMNRAATRWHFWHRLAERLDALVAYPIKNAVSEQQLRRVDQDIKRCRELMSRNPPGDAKLVRMRLARGIRAVEIR
jgi:hypothetical protein